MGLGSVIEVDTSQPVDVQALEVQVAALLEAGYDGLVVRDGGGDGIDFVIALVDEVIRVVVDR